MEANKKFPKLCEEFDFDQVTELLHPVHDFAFGGYRENTYTSHTRNSPRGWKLMWGFLCISIFFLDLALLN